MARRRDGNETKARILEAACDVFGRCGYHEGTHAEICRHAGVNTAAINYHFGEKATLYSAAFEHATQEIVDRHPLNGNLPENAPARKKLHAAIRALVGRMLDQDMEPFHRIHMKELFNPTGLVEDALVAKMRSQSSYIRAICREILGSKATEKDVNICGLSVAALCRMPHPPPILKRFPVMRFTQEDLDTLTEHITRFSLAGIHAMRRRIKAREQ